MSGVQCQRSWAVVRAQIIAHMARCEVQADDEALTPDEQRIFRVEEAEPYYGPTGSAATAINRILGLDATAGQPAWEIEAGNASSLGRLVDALGDASLDTEERSAVALLLLDCLDRGASGGTSVTELLARIRWHLRADARVQSRMRYWWTHMEGSGAVMEALS